MDKMSFSRFISPANKEEVLLDLQQAFESSGESCILGASKYHWINYDDDKLVNSYSNYQALNVE